MVVRISCDNQTLAKRRQMSQLNDFILANLLFFCQRNISQIKFIKIDCRFNMKIFICELFWSQTNVSWQVIFKHDNLRSHIAKPAKGREFES